MSRSLKKSAFVAMPFAEKFDIIYDAAIKAAAVDVGLVLIRLGRLPMDEIVQHMEDEIGRSDFVVSVATGRNPHVYCELGLAHAARKPCIIIADKPSDYEIFGNLHRCFVYGDDLGELRIKLREEFKRLIAV
jgi:hypothetical protein